MVRAFPEAIRVPDFLFIVISFFHIDLLSPDSRVYWFPNILSIFRLFPEDRSRCDGFGFW